MIDKERLKQMFVEAMDLLIEIDHENIEYDVTERNLCARLAMYLEDQLDPDDEELAPYFADVEYNRMREGKIKTIIDHKQRVVEVCCDLIVHSRGVLETDDNLLAIEMKKSTRPLPHKMSDKIRLRALTKTEDIWPASAGVEPEHVCGYKIAYYVELVSHKRYFKVEQYELGEVVGVWEMPF
jgi:hypothetical protein